MDTESSNNEDDVSKPLSSNDGKNASQPSSTHKTSTRSGPSPAAEQSLTQPVTKKNPVAYSKGPTCPTRRRESAPIIRLSVMLIHTYTSINRRYYGAKERSWVKTHRSAAKKIEKAAGAKIEKHEKAAAAASSSTSQKVSSSSTGSTQNKTVKQHPESSSSNILSQQSSSSSTSKSKHTSSTTRKNQPEDYPVRKGEIWSQQYQIIELLGKGSFGQVVRAYDMLKNEDVAIKIIKNRKAFNRQAQIEIEILKKLAPKTTASSPRSSGSSSHVVKMLRHFTHCNHICIVFELLSYSLFHLLEGTSFQGVSLNLIRKFADQICSALAFLQKLGIIHCDLKPENILLANPKRSNIKIIDFGSSCEVNDRPYSYIQSRFYRSPEVILGMEYDTAIDMWSFGCILVELHTGDPLFAGTDEIDQMYRIVEVLDMPYDYILEQSTKAKKFFDHIDGSGCNNATWKPKREYYTKCPGNRSLETIIDNCSPFGRQQTKDYHQKPPSILSKMKDAISDSELLKFKQFVSRLLEYDPRMRITPRFAQSHPFMTRTAECATNTSLSSSRSKKSSYVNTKDDKVLNTALSSNITARESSSASTDMDHHGVDFTLSTAPCAASSLSTTTTATPQQHSTSKSLANLPSSTEQNDSLLKQYTQQSNIVKNNNYHRFSLGMSSPIKALHSIQSRHGAQMHTCVPDLQAAQITNTCMLCNQHIKPDNKMQISPQTIQPTRQLVSPNSVMLGDCFVRQTVLGTGDFQNNPRVHHNTYNILSDRDLLSAATVVGHTRFGQETCSNQASSMNTSSQSSYSHAHNLNIPATSILPERLNLAHFQHHQRQPSPQQQTDTQVSSRLTSDISSRNYEPCNQAPE